MSIVNRLKFPDGSHISYMHTMLSSSATVVCLGGFSSEMKGRKATSLHDFCVSQNIDCVIFDYLGHGVSSGVFGDYSISDWVRNCCQVIEATTKKPLILVGTSMGGWIMLHVAAKYSERVLGMVGLAVAPDFTEELCMSLLEKEEFLVTSRVTSYVRRICRYLGMSPELGNKESLRIDHVESKRIFETQKITILKGGRPHTITPKLKEDGKRHMLLDKEYIPIHCDTVLIHSIADDTIPYTASTSVAEKVLSKNVHVHLIKSSDHLLNDAEPLEIAFEAIRRLIK